LFGYQLLSLFLVVCVFKWALVFATARHMVLTGAHPFQRWVELPGPRGWLPMVFLLLAIVSFPIWVSFHAGTLGTLVSGLLHPETSGTETHLLWGMVILFIVVGLTFTGSYGRLEKLQLIFVLLMLFAVTVSLFLVHPEWGDLLAGFANVTPPVYPEWVAEHPDIAKRPVWVELSTYVGVIGGSGYDYLAYVTYLRDKQWGLASNEQPSPVPVAAHDEAARIRLRQWCRAPLIDCTMSFAIVLLFFLPWLDRSKVRSIRYRGWMYKTMLILFAVNFVMLGYLGTVNPGHVDLIWFKNVTWAQIGLVVYFAFFLLMPIYTKLDRNKPEPDRVR